jgi:hypothetical protein
MLATSRRQGTEAVVRTMRERCQTALQRTRGTRAVELSAMPILDASHDLAHEVEDNPAWSESYYFNAYDPAVDAGFVTRLSTRG